MTIRAAKTQATQQETETMQDLTDTITQADMDAMSNAVICNYAEGIGGVAMQARIARTDEDGDAIEIAVYFEIREGEEQDNEAIYTLDRIIEARQIS